MDRSNKYRFIVIGINDDDDQSFSAEIIDLIQNGTVFSGGLRHKKIITRYLPKDYKWIDITVPIKNVLNEYLSYSDIIIFASGDPLFYGFANTLLREYPEAEIKVYPTFNSLQMLAHRLLLPYQDMRVVSLTGRDWTCFDRALIEGENLIGILTDRVKTPAVIVRRMLEFGYNNYRVAVGESLGNKKEEKALFYSLNEVTEKNFCFPNNMVLQRIGVHSRPFGIPEKDFYLLNGRAKMITKMPVRLLSMSLLDLRERFSFWDVGACTGSVSVEAKLQFPQLNITAFEKRPECENIININARKFGTPGINVHIGDFMDMDLTDISCPDAVFIGGHGGKLKEIITRIHPLLKTNGVIVFNSVSKDSRVLFEEAIASVRRKITQCISIQVDQYNSIDVIKAE